jgi:hypothetical protein
MNNSRKLVRIRIETGRPKRKSGVYVTILRWGAHGGSRQKEGGVVMDLRVFQQFQIEEGPNIFDGLKFKLIPCED